MKTQLLEDIGDNGSRSTPSTAPPQADAPAPASPPQPPPQQETALPLQPAAPGLAAPPRPLQAPGERAPAVWHRPQVRGSTVPGQRATEHGSTQPAPRPRGLPAGAASGPVRPATSHGARIGAWDEPATVVPAPQTAPPPPQPPPPPRTHPAPDQPSPRAFRTGQATPPLGAFSATGPMAPEPAWPHAQPRPGPGMPPPGAFSATTPVASELPPSGRGSAGADFTAGNVRRPAAHVDAPDAVSGWTRRALGWSLGFSLLAAVVAGGLWLYEDRRVEGALVVVAHRGAAQEPAAPRASATAALLPAPAPAGTGAAVGTAAVADARMAAPSDAVAPAPRDGRINESGAPGVATPGVATPGVPTPGVPTPGPVTPDAATRRAATPSSPDVESALAGPARIADEAAPTPSRERLARRQERRERYERQARQAREAREARHARRPAPAVVPEPVREPATPSPRQRREETLMQCRAHGYDEQQCVARGCDMTRFGFACRG
jgi:hypothetical protein